LDAEKMRQLYVVMTRAKQRVYVPVIEAPNVKEAKAGMASPFELYLEKLGEPLESFVSRQPKEQMTYEVLETAEMPAHEPSELRKVPPPVQVTIPGKARFIDSFSSMYSSSADQTLKPPHDFHTEEKTIHTLPAGSETGIILHRLLEKIPFRQYRDSKEIDPLLVIEEAYSEWRPVLAECVYEALHTPLDGFCLADIDSDAVYREVEFLYPTSNGFTKGVIDLAFSHRGTCYLLDWKSNWLGPDNEAYRPEHLQEVMEHHHYYRQAEIYEEAFERYLNLFDNARFGGTFYVFLRGMAVLLVDKMSAASRNIE
jgi:exodeoxyribonuclease V beta subunit